MKKFKYEVGQEIIILHSEDNSVLKTTAWQELIVRIIDLRFIDTSIEEHTERYRIDGLWFNKNEVKGVSRETHPEYYL